MIIADLNRIEGRSYPARRRTQNLVGGASPIGVEHFSMGFVTLEPDGGQVPWMLGFDVGGYRQGADAALESRIATLIICR